MMIMTVFIIFAVFFLIATNVNMNYSKKPTVTLDDCIYSDDGLPIITANIGGDDMKFLLDTGSNQNIINPSILSDELKSTMVDGGRHDLTSASGVSEYEYKILSTQIDIGSIGMHDIEFRSMENMNSVFECIEEALGVKIAGLIGTPFMKSINISINLKDNECSFYDKDK